MNHYTSSSLEQVERERGYTFPAAYRELILAHGAFEVGRFLSVTDGAGFLSLLAPSMSKTRYGDRYGEVLRAVEIGTENDAKAHDDIIIFATSGTFPQEVVGYSGGLAFRIGEPETVLVYECDAGEAAGWSGEIEFVSVMEPQRDFRFDLVTDSNVIRRDLGFAEIRSRAAGVEVTVARERAVRT